MLSVPSEMKLVVQLLPGGRARLSCNHVLPRRGPAEPGQEHSCPECSEGYAVRPAARWLAASYRHPADLSPYARKNRALHRVLNLWTFEEYLTAVTEAHPGGLLHLYLDPRFLNSVPTKLVSTLYAGLRAIEQEFALTRLAHLDPDAARREEYLTEARDLAATWLELILSTVDVKQPWKFSLC